MQRVEEFHHFFAQPQNAVKIQFPIPEIGYTHTTWLLSLAKTMATLKEQWKGIVILLIQPAEESIEGGTAMVEDGLYTTHGVPEPEYALAMHTGRAADMTGCSVTARGLEKSFCFSYSCTIFLILSACLSVFGACRSRIDIKPVRLC